MARSAIRPGLGVQLAPDRLVAEFGLKGVLILGVQPGSPAAKAGLHPTRRGPSNLIQLGDVIVAVNDQPVGSLKDLFAALADYELGDKLKLTVLRDGARQDLEITLDNIP